MGLIISDMAMQNNQVRNSQILFDTYLHVRSMQHNQRTEEEGRCHDLTVCVAATSLRIDNSNPGNHSFKAIN